jgi:hypothetical protein
MLFRGVMEFKEKSLLSEKKKYWENPKPAYLMIGSGQSNRMFPEGNVDALLLIGSLNKSQLLIFLQLRDLITINYQLDKKYPKLSRNMNEISLKLDGLDELKRLMQRNNNVKNLTELGIIRKGKHKRYMVNPFILIPSRDFKWHAATWMYYKYIDVENGVGIDQVMISMDMSIDESIKNMNTIIS